MKQEEQGNCIFLMRSEIFCSLHQAEVPKYWLFFFFVVGFFASHSPQLRRGIFLGASCAPFGPSALQNVLSQLALIK